MVEAPERIWADLNIDGPRLAPSRLREIIETKEFRYTEAFMLPATWLDLLKRNEELERQIAELRAELDRAIDERDEARQEPWPKWADEIRKCLEGYGVDPGDEWDLPEQFEIWIADVVENETARAEVLAEENARLKALPLKDEVERVLERLAEIADTEDEVGREPGCEDDDSILVVQAHDCQLAELTVSDFRAARALLSRLRAGEQEGWQLVPVEPTEAMIDARFRVLGQGGKAEWDAMLAAAPSEYGGEHG